MTRRSSPLLASLAGLALLVACGDGGVGSREEITFRMQRIDGVASLQVVGDWSASLVGGSAVAVAPDTVQSLTVTIDSIQALPVTSEGDEENDAAWVTVNLDAPATLDLMALPTEGESPVVVAAGTVEAGDYANVRLFVSDASIVFKGPINIGMAFTFDGGEAYDVTVPRLTKVTSDKQLGGLACLSVPVTRFVILRVQNEVPDPKPPAVARTMSNSRASRLTRRTIRRP